MKMTALLFVIIATLAVTAGAQEPAVESDTYFPQQFSARDLLNTCAASSLTATGRSRQGYCRGFVSGVEEAMRLLLLRDSVVAREPFCIPAGTRSSALADTFIRYASRPGADLERPSASVVLEALMKGYPC